jgi:hypothetical protein
MRAELQTPYPCIYSTLPLIGGSKSRDMDLVSIILDAYSATNAAEMRGREEGDGVRT